MGNIGCPLFLMKNTQLLKPAPRFSGGPNPVYSSREKGYSSQVKGCPYLHKFIQKLRPLACTKLILS